MRYNSCNIQFTHLQHTIQWLLVYPPNCGFATITTINLRTFSLPKRNPERITSYRSLFSSTALPRTPGNHYSTFFLYVFAYSDIHMCEIVQYVVFCDWLLLFSMFSRFIHMSVVHSFLFPNNTMILNIFSCVYWPCVYFLWRNVCSDILPNF